MQNQLPFDLNRAIQRWRENLAQSPAFRSENLNELESHLRDSIATLQTRGLSAEEAFSVAEKRIGKVKGLEKEFSKVNQSSVWRDRVLWMLIGIQAWGLVSNVIISVARTGLLIGWRSTEYHPGESSLAIPITVFSLVQVLAMAASIALCWWLVVRNGPRFDRWLSPWLRRRSTLFAACAGLCMVVLASRCLYAVVTVFMARFLPPEAFRSTALYTSYSGLISVPVQVVTMIAITVFLVRKRFPASQSERVK